MAVSNSIDNIRTNRTAIETWKQTWNQNKCMDISSDKLAKSQKRRPGHGNERETLREKSNDIKAKIDNTQQSSKCRLCGDKSGIINHIISECSKQAKSSISLGTTRWGR